YWKRGTASSGCGSSRILETRPDRTASNSGSRPPFRRLCTSEEMKTVLPARDRPVTPSRIDGLTRPAARSERLSRAIRASAARFVSVGGTRVFRIEPVAGDIGRHAAGIKEPPAAGSARRARRDETGEPGDRQFGRLRPPVEVENGKS